MNRPRIAFLTTLDPLSKRTWSGTVHYMGQALRKHCGEVVFLGPVPHGQLGGRLYNRLVRFLFGKRHDYSHSLPYARFCGRYFNDRLQRERFDVVFAPAASTGIAFLDTAIPIVYASDATFGLLKDYYPEFTQLTGRSAGAGEIIERLAIGKARISLFSSHWAADSAVNVYGAPPERVRVIPFGANLDTVPDGGSAVRRKGTGRLRLLFLATDWRRKGGDLALDTLTSIHRRGVDAELVVCGCTSPTTIHHERMTVVPFLSKDEPRQGERLFELLGSADLLLVPTRHDCTPIVFCEANAFGVPVVTTATGGVPELVRNGENGIILPYSARGEDYAEAIFRLWAAPGRYAALRKSSRGAFDTRLNWDSWASAVDEILAEVTNRAEQVRTAA